MHEGDCFFSAAALNDECRLHMYIYMYVYKSACGWNVDCAGAPSSGRSEGMEKWLSLIIHFLPFLLHFFAISHRGGSACLVGDRRRLVGRSRVGKKHPLPRLPPTQTPSTRHHHAIQRTCFVSVLPKRWRFNYQKGKLDVNKSSFSDR